MDRNDEDDNRVSLLQFADEKRVVRLCLKSELSRSCFVLHVLPMYETQDSAHSSHGHLAAGARDLASSFYG